MSKLVDIVIEKINKKVPLQEQLSYNRIHTQLDNPDVEQRIGVFSDYDDSEITPDHLNKALDDSDWRVRYRAAYHPNASSDNIHKALSDEDVAVRTSALENPNIEEHHISKALNDSDTNVRSDAIKHPKTTENHLRSAIMDSNSDIRHYAVDTLYKMMNR